MEVLKQKLKPDSRWTVQLFRYFIVGGLATLADIAVFTLLFKVFHFHYLWVSQPAGFVVGLCINYLLSITVVFSNRTLTSKHKERFLFFLTALIGFVLNSLLLYLFVEMGQLEGFVSKILAVIITFAWNFLSKKILLFK